MLFKANRYRHVHRFAQWRAQRAEAAAKRARSAERRIGAGLAVLLDLEAQS